MKKPELVTGELQRNPQIWEEAIGPFERIWPSPAVALVRVEAIDVFHQDPRQVADPPLQGYRLVPLIFPIEAAER